MLAPLNELPPLAAFIDLGTNSARMIMVRINRNQSYTILSQQKEMIRLGQGEFKRHRLRQDAMDRAVLVLANFARMARMNRADPIVAVATSATREARNQDEFIQRLAEEAGLEVRVISGKEEARLIYLGLAGGIELGREKALFIDIGGGSTEIIVGDRRQHHILESVKVGAIRLTAEHLDGQEGKVSPARFAGLKREVKNAAVRAIQRTRRLGFGPAYGSSGTIQNLAEIGHANFGAKAGVSEKILSLEALAQTSKLLCSLTLEQRRKVKGINPSRADIIVAGAAILETLLEETGARWIEVTDLGLKEGLLADYLAGSEIGDLITELSVRERSVLQLGRNCGFDEDHHRHVRDLALKLYDSAGLIGLHDLGLHPRELLSHAAMLHDVGAFLSYNNHHGHAYYIIKNADLLGFSREELEIIAATAFFHRKTMATQRHSEFASLSRRGQEAVRVLSIVLRIAESLDRSHAGLVRDAAFEREGKRTIVLRLTTEKECDLETWGAKKHEKAFKKTFKLTLVQACDVNPGRKPKSRPQS